MELTHLGSEVSNYCNIDDIHNADKLNPSEIIDCLIHITGILENNDNNSLLL